MLTDIRTAWRSIRRSPGFALSAVLTLSLTVGVNTAVFSVADAVLFRPLPYADPDRLFVLQVGDPQSGTRYGFVPDDLLRWISERAANLGELGTLEIRRSAVVDTPDGPERVAIAQVSPDYFRILGVHAARGRLFAGDERSHGEEAAILSHGAWRRRFGADETVVGRDVSLGTATFRIVGILPETFVFPAGTPAQPEITMLAPEALVEDGAVSPILRLPEGATPEAVQARLASVASGWRSARDPDARSVPVLADIRSVMYPSGRPVLGFLLAAALLVVLLGCANLAHHLSLRSDHHRRELAVRLALGASRGRLVRPLLIESVMVGAAAGSLAVLVNAVAFEALIREVPSALYRGAPVGVSLRVVVFALALGIGSGVMFACVPAWRAARYDVQPLLRSWAEPAVRGLRGHWLVTVQTALAIALVSGAVVAAQALVSALGVPLGFSHENVAVVRISPREADSGPTLDALYERALESLRGRAEVLGAGATSSLPLDGQAAESAVRALGGGRVGLVGVLPGYFEAAGIRLVRGRLLDPRDLRRGDNPAVVSEHAIGLLAPPSRDVIGETLEGIDGRRFVVVGVVGDVASSLQHPDVPLVYSVPGAMKQPMTIVLRTRARTNDLLAGIRRTVGQLAAGAPVTAAWWSDSIAALPGYRTPRLQALLLGAFSLLALGLASLGTYVAVSFATALRTREIGIRLALGATRSSLVARMLGQALVPVSTGVVAGVIASVWLAGLASARISAVAPQLSITLATSCTLVLAAATLAAYWPASRASRCDPAVVLRVE